MSFIINWPVDPSEGDIYKSPNGDYWVFRDCMWVSTCCPDLCGYEDGLTFWVIAEISSYIKIKFNYSGVDENGRPFFEYHIYNNLIFNDLVVVYNSNLSKWIIATVGNDGASTIAWGDSLYGNWYSDNLFFGKTSCGGTDSSCCFSLIDNKGDETYRLTLLPIYESSSSSYPIGFSNLIAQSGSMLTISWNGTGWDLATDIPDICSFIISGSLIGGPSGSYNLNTYCEIDATVNITSPNCECNKCNPEKDGIYIQFFSDANFQNYTIVNLSWNGNVYESAQIFIKGGTVYYTLSFNNNYWELSISGQIISVSDSLFGFYNITLPLPVIERLRVICGQSSLENLCLSYYDGTAGPSVYEFRTLFPIWSSTGIFSYYSSDYSVEYNSSIDVWELLISDGSSVAYSPYVSGPWTITDPTYYDILTSSGDC